MLKYLWLVLIFFAYLYQQLQQDIMATSRQVLPTNVRPVHYHLSLRPNLSTFKFDGRVQVK
jgi:hypothetical protein